MNVIYADQPIEKLLELSRHNIFLAGPTPRSPDVPSWRPDAIDILAGFNYSGQVLVPERSDKTWKMNYEDQVEWEHYGLENCYRIAFWVPRVMETMPALTTNVEFGRYVASGRARYGRPDDAVKCRYLDWLYKKYNSHPIHTTLKDLMNAVSWVH
jgi:hypothetical protein